MALDTYANLQTAIINHAWRTGDDIFTAAVPDLITLLETRLNRRLRIKQQETSATITLTSGVGTLPSDYLQWRDIKADSDPAISLKPMPASYGQTEYPNASGGYANHFYIVDDQITTVPASDANLTITYYANIPVLSVGSPTNWLLTLAPDLYLYGALMESAPFMMDDPRLATWGTLFESALKDVQDTNFKANFSKSTMRQRGPTP